MAGMDTIASDWHATEGLTLRKTWNPLRITLFGAPSSFPGRAVGMRRMSPSPSREDCQCILDEVDAGIGA
ncbi:hypothetical protein QF034_005229 [Streptomyces africanus]|uniref:Uncharacterized protein n=1 Tax=Streptomyces africanus TaxID=231024 RepID=A0ABU0QUB5_9ACTN|nr:hypothetical protein [Streptomyces africanus]